MSSRSQPYPQVDEGPCCLQNGGRAFCSYLGHEQVLWTPEFSLPQTALAPAPSAGDPGGPCPSLLPAMKVGPGSLWWVSSKAHSVWKQMLYSWGNWDQASRESIWALRESTSSWLQGRIPVFLLRWEQWTLWGVENKGHIGLVEAKS